MDTTKKSGNNYIRYVRYLAYLGLFVFALVASAWTGILLAKKNLPDWVGEESGIVRGDELVVGGEGQMVYLAEENQKIKDFFIRYKTEDKRLRADVDEAKVRRLSAEVTIRVKRRDAGTVSIEVISGPLNGETFWMPLSHLSQQKKIEDLPLIKEDK